ncbi:hypothetical protein CHS0354_000786 [Potamilus streckersoni]|uniref:Carbohydrate kinase PfkB domain-containing protein n=1 Tax=Potamilus streckersoni TaxID=2493646 RepID=A0AAE0T7Z7_9BIVA|nr:hypothetical protein CHS0354_000786 [Potamilus streckersoni]
MLWDCYPEKQLPGGAPMNVALHLVKNNIPATMVSAVGNDEHGATLLGYLHDAGVETNLIQVHNSMKTGLVKIDPIYDGFAKFNIMNPAAWDFISLTNDLKKSTNNVSAIVFGTLSARNAESRKTLLALLHSSSEIKIFDLNFRQHYYSKELVNELLLLSTLLKLSDEELPIISEWYGFNGDEKDTLQQLSQRFSLECICLTKGAHGACVLKNNVFLKHPGYRVHTEDTTGAGDAFLAGFISKQFNGESLETALDYSSRLGAYVASKMGATPDYKPNEIYQTVKDLN